MKNNLYLELTDRTKQIFKTVVESYLEQLIKDDDKATVSMFSRLQAWLKN